MQSTSDTTVSQVKNNDLGRELVLGPPSAPDRHTQNSSMLGRFPANLLSRSLRKDPRGRSGAAPKGVEGRNSEKCNFGESKRPPTLIGTWEPGTPGTRLYPSSG